VGRIFKQTDQGWNGSLGAAANQCQGIGSIRTCTRILTAELADPETHALTVNNRIVRILGPE
jgi:hypothetical protein